MLAGFVTLGTFMVALGMLIVGLFAWLRQDIRELRREIGSLREEMSGRMDSLRDELFGRFDSLRDEVGKWSERVARIEGLLEAVFMRRDLTPLPEPPPAEPSPSGDRPGKPRAA